MRVYTCKLTPDSVVTYLVHDCERSLWLFCLRVARACDDQSTVHLDWQEATVLRLCAMFEELTEFCFVFRFGFRASLLAFTSRIERLHVCYYCANVWSVLAHFCIAIQSRTSIGRQVRSGHRQRVYIAVSWRDRRSISCLHSTVAVAAPARLRLVARSCALVRNSLQTSCLQWVMTRYHTLDTMLEIGARK